MSDMSCDYCQHWWRCHTHELCYFTENTLYCAVTFSQSVLHNRCPIIFCHFLWVKKTTVFTPFVIVVLLTLGCGMSRVSCRAFVDKILEKGSLNKIFHTISVIPHKFSIDLIHKSQNALVPYPTMLWTEMCTFLFWMEHCGIRNRWILGFVKLVYYHMASVIEELICRKSTFATPQYLPRNIYAQSLCFVMVWCWSISSIFFRVASLALGQSYDMIAPAPVK